MQIVSMTAEHVSRLAELEKLCFSEPWSEKSLTEEIDNPAACFLVAMQQDEVLGYGGMHTVLGESYVDNIAVFPGVSRPWCGQNAHGGADRKSAGKTAAFSSRWRCGHQTCRPLRCTVRSALRKRACAAIFIQNQERMRWFLRSLSEFLAIRG